MTETSQLLCELGETEQPVTGDWVAISHADASRLHPTVVQVLPRSSTVRRAEGGGGQILAANVDLVFVVAALTSERNLVRVERYLAVAWESGARPIIVLTKADLSDHTADDIVEAAGAVPVIRTSAVSREGLDDLLSMLAENLTAVVLGPSGVGKSTLINALVGAEVLDTGPIRQSDSRGRHTTTTRELLEVPGGGVIIDTPGLREISPTDESSVDIVFSDIAALMTHCRFRDCAHQVEPGCAILDAISASTLDRDRWMRYLDMQRAARRFERLANKQSRIAASAKTKKTRRDKYPIDIDEY